MAENIIKLNNIQEVTTLFDNIAPEANLPAICYEKTRYIPWSVFQNMQVYALDFEPYLSIAQRCNMHYFGIMQSKHRVYLAHSNDTGHAPRWEARPMTLAQLMDSELMEYLNQNHAYNLGLKISFDLDYAI